MATGLNPIQSPCAEAQALALVRDHPCAEQARKWVMLACVLASSLAFIDGTIVNVALPELQKIFSTSVSRVQWVLESYQLFSSALLLVCGAIGDHYGRRRALRAGVVIFVSASIWCGMSPQITHLIVARAVQGIGAALLIPASLSLLASAYPEDLRGRAIGTWSAWTGVCAALGPVAGGWLIEHASWRLIFFVNVPVGAAVLLCLTRVQESRDSETEHAQLDWLGAALITLSLAGLILGLLDAPALGWSAPRIVGCLVAGGSLLLIFLWVESRRQNAMMPLRLFHSHNFSAVNALTFLLYGALGGALFFLPFYLIQVKHFTATEAGAAFLPFIVLMFLFSGRVGNLMPRLGARPLLVAGPLIAGFGYVLFALLTSQPGYVRAILPAILVLSIGMTLSVTPLTTTVLNSVREQESGVASGVNNAVSRVAALLAIAILGAVLQATFSSRLAANLRTSKLNTAQQAEIYSQRGRLLDARLTTANPGAQAEANRVLDESFVAGFRRVMQISALSCFLGAVIVAIFVQRTNQQPNAAQKRLDAIHSRK